MEGRRPVVIDNGSGFLKAGFAGVKEPTVIFPAVVGKKKPRCRRLSLADQYTGEEAVQQRGNVTLRHPVERGVVSQWSEMEMVWEHAYNRLPATPHRQNVLITESVLNPKPNRRRTVETFLETLRVPGVLVADTPSLCLYTLDGGTTTTGLILESGYSATYAVPIVGGKVMRQAVTRLDLGGNDLTVFLLRLVESRGSFLPPAKRERFWEVKEKLCYVAMDFAREEETVKLFEGRPQTSGIKQSYDLAGDIVTLATERFQCPESLFQPNWLRVDAMGVHKLVYNAIEKCPADAQGQLYENIIVTGGSTCFPGFLQRLETELGRLCPEEYLLNVQAPESPKTLAWRGGSELCLSQDAQEKWITLKEYQEVGEDILERKRGVFKTEDGGNEKPDRDVTDGASRQDIGSRGSQETVMSSSRSSSRKTGSNTPASSLYKRTSQIPSAASTPGLSCQTSPIIFQPRNSDFRGSRLYRTNKSTTPDMDTIQSLIHPSPSPNKSLTTKKRKDEVRPKSPGLHENIPFRPTLPKTPEVSDDEDEEAGQDQEEATESSGVRKMSLDFDGFRRMSLFDHLMEEVATFSPRSEYAEDNGDRSGDTHGISLLYHIKEEDLLPGGGISGLTRNETINVDSFNRSSPRSQAAEERHEVPGAEVPGRGDLAMQCLVPAIEITTCPTPHGSASPESDSEQPTPADYEPRKIMFKFDE